MLTSHWGEGNDIQESIQAPSLFFLHDSTTVLGFPTPAQLSFIHPPLLPRNDIFPHAQSPSFFYFHFSHALFKIHASILPDLGAKSSTLLYLSVNCHYLTPRRFEGFFISTEKSCRHLDMLMACLALCLNAINLLLPASTSGKAVIINIYGKGDSFSVCRTGRSETVLT